MDRRSLLRLGALGAAGLAGGGFIAACGDESTTSPTSPTSPSNTTSPTTTAPKATIPGSTATTASLPKAGSGVARLTIIANSTDQLDPAKFVGTSFDSVFAASLYSTLTRVTTGYELSGELAEDWDTPDAKVWTFRLRDGLVFHDGRPLTSADVAYTLRRILDPETASGGASLIAGLQASGIATPDATTVRLTLDEPNAFLPVSLAWINFGVVPVDTTDFTTGIGSGPFQLVNFETGASAQLSRSDKYFKDGRPYLEGVEVLGAADAAAQVQALLTGQTDLLHAVGFNQIGEIEGASDYELMEIAGGQWPTFAARTVDSPFTDPLVVEALKYAVDREKFSTVAYGGLAVPSADVPIPVDDLYYPEGLEAREYDPERAKALLTEAGFPDGIELELFTRDAGNFLQNATALQSVVEPGGFRLTLNNWPPDTYWDEVWLQKPFVTDVWGRSHASYILPVAYGSDSGSNETAFADPVFDGLVADAMASANLEDQKRYFGEAIRILHESSGSVTPVHTPLITAKSTKLQGLIPDWGTRFYLEEATLD